VDRGQALDLLPPLYAVALRLAEAGAPPSVIAEGVDIAPAAVPAFLEVAEGKLERLLRDEAT
jgi:hypothetical protein